MAIIFTDGFEAYSGAASDTFKTTMCLDDRYIGGGGAATFTGGLVSLGSPGKMLPGAGTSQYLSFSASNSTSNRMMINFASTTSLCVGFHVSIGAVTANLLTLFNTSAATASADVIQVYVSNSTLFVKGNLAYSGSATMALNTWNYVEFQVTTSGQTMTFGLYVNGQLVLSGTNVQALSSTASFQSINGLSIGRGNSAWVVGTSAIQNYDNLYVTTGERLGLTYMAPVLPAADTAQKQWIPINDIVNYTSVNDQIVSTGSTYLVANNVNDADYYAVSQINRKDGNTTVLGVLPYMQACGSVLGTTGVDLKIKSGSTETTPVTASLAATRVNSVTRPTSLVTNDPNTGTSWNMSGIQNMQLGIKRSS